MTENRNGACRGAESESVSLVNENGSENTVFLVPDQDEQRRLGLLAELRLVQVEGYAFVDEAAAIYRALDRRWISCRTAEIWGAMTGVLRPAPAPMAHWSAAALEWRREKYGRNGLLEGGR